MTCAVAAGAQAQTVKITPLGAQAGEYCATDRAMLFEDPTGVRIVYDVGASVAGSGDPRLGDVHVMLLSHAHGDHIGANKATGLNAGTCAKPETVSALPATNTGEIIAAKNSAIMTGNDMAAFLAKKVEAILGARVEDCAESGLTRDTIHAVRGAFKLIFKQDGGSLEDRARAAKDKWPAVEQVREIADFILAEHKQAICLARKRGGADED